MHQGICSTGLTHSTPASQHKAPLPHSTHHPCFAKHSTPVLQNTAPLPHNTQHPCTQHTTPLLDNTQYFCYTKHSTSASQHSSSLSLLKLAPTSVRHHVLSNTRASRLKYHIPQLCWLTGAAIIVPQARQTLSSHLAQGTITTSTITAGTITAGTITATEPASWAGGAPFPCTNPVLVQPSLRSQGVQ